MPLESATYVDDLVSTNPLGTDDASLGDDHIRLIKSVLKNTFPNLDGALTTKLAALNGVSQLITVGSDGKTLTFNFPSGGTVGSVTDWTSNQPVPASQADGRYARDGAVFTIGANTNKLNSNILYGNSYRLSFQDDENMVLYDTSSNSVIFQLSEDSISWKGKALALRGDLNTETTNRTNADANLQNQINNRVLKTGDTSTGSQFTRNKYDNGTLHWAPGWTSVIAGMSGGSSTGDYSFGMWAQILDGVYTAGILSLNGFQGRKDFRFNEDGNIFTPLGTVALTSELPSLPFQTLKSWTLTHVNSMTTFQLPQTYKTPPLMWCQDVSSVDVHYACIRNVTTTDYLIQTSSNNWIPELQIFCLGDPA